MKRLLINAVRMMMLLMYRFFRAFPRKRRIVCLSRESDRPTTDFRLIRHYVRQTHPDYSVVILAKKRHNPVRYGFHMIRQLYFIATSQAVLLDTYAIVVSLLAGYIDVPVIQMWHALGNMKKFGYTALGSKEGRKFSTASLLNMHRGYTSVPTSSSKSFISDYARGFDIDPSAIIYEAPLPRTDLLINSSYRAQQRERIIREFPGTRAQAQHRLLPHVPQKDARQSDSGGSSPRRCHRLRQVQPDREMPSVGRPAYQQSARIPALSEPVRHAVRRRLRHQRLFDRDL